MPVPDRRRTPAAAGRRGRDDLPDHRRHGVHRHVVWTSSSGVFGPAHRYAEPVLPNDAAHFPVYVYRACKSLNETAATHYFDKPVEEAARKILMAADAPKTATRVFNTSGEVTRVRDAVDRVRAILPDVDIRAEAGVYMGAGVTPWYDTGLLEEEIGFKTRFGLEERLRRSINEVRKWHGLPRTERKDNG